MINEINILILSCGSRNKIVQYFKESLKGRGKVVGADCSSYAPALYEADRYYIVSKITEDSYWNEILDICQKEKITGILSLIDPELSVLAKNKKQLEALNIRLIGSEYLQCERCLDKYQMYLWLKDHGYRCAKTYVDKEAFYHDKEAGIIDYPVFVKPIRGSASTAISKVYDRDTLEVLFAQERELLIQEYLEGQEIGADCYIDLLNGKMVSVFTKNKLVMRAGETDKAISFKDPVLFDWIIKFAEEFGLRGQIDIDIFRIKENYYISEVNPRFGGGYPHAYECGVNHIDLIINNLCHEENDVSIGNYPDNLVMMKYNEVKVIHGDGSDDAAK